MFYKLGRAGGLLEKFGAVDFATTIAPGVRDVLLTGKVYEAVRRRRDPKARGPRGQTGVRRRGPRRTPRPGASSASSTSTHEVAGVAKVGPDPQPGRLDHRDDASPQTVVHVVTLLEEMPVQETVDAIAELRKAGFGDRRRRRQPGPRAAAAGGQRSQRRPGPGSHAGDGHRRPRGRRRCGPATRWSRGLLTQARDHADRVSLEQRAGADRRSGWGVRPTGCRYLPDGIDAGAIRELADAARRPGDGLMARTTTTASRARAPKAPPLDIDDLISDPGTRIIVCCGSGGVGKTTTAAALGVRAAEAGRKVVVLTIDPARRLAQSLGLTELDNEPRAGDRHRHSRPAAPSTR